MDGPLAVPFRPVSVEEFQSHLKESKVKYQSRVSLGSNELIAYKGVGIFSKKTVIPLTEDKSLEGQIKQQRSFCDACVALEIPIPDQLRTLDRAEYSAGLRLKEDLPRSVRFADDGNGGLRVSNPVVGGPEATVVIARSDFYLDYSKFGADGTEPAHYDYSKFGTDGVELFIEPSEAARVAQVMGVAPSPGWIRVSPRPASFNKRFGSRTTLADGLRLMPGASRSDGTRPPNVADEADEESMEFIYPEIEVSEYAKFVQENHAERGEGEIKTQEVLWKEYEEMHPDENLERWHGDEKHSESVSSDGEGESGRK